MTIRCILHNRELSYILKLSQQPWNGRNANNHCQKREGAK